MKNSQKFVFKIGIAAFLLLAITSCDGCKPETDPVVKVGDVEEILITDGQAKTRFENYSEHRGKIIEIYENNGRNIGDSLSRNQQDIKGKQPDNTAANQDIENGFVPTQYSSYDFEKFKKYLTYIEQETRKAGADISTLRIYFTNYPESETDKNKQKRNSVMFVPTIDVNGNESAYYLSDEGDNEKSRPFLLNDSFERTGKPAPTGSLYNSKSTNEANLLPNMPNLNSTSPPVFFAEKSVIGNEGSLHPPSHN